MKVWTCITAPHINALTHTVVVRVVVLASIVVVVVAVLAVVAVVAVIEVVAVVEVDLKVIKLIAVTLLLI